MVRSGRDTSIRYSLKKELTDYDHPGIEHSSGISAEQTEPTTDSTISTDTDTVEDSSARRYPQRDRRPPERLTY